MKQITSLWLLVLFMASTTLIAQNTSTGLASQKAEAAKYKTELQQNLNAELQPGVIPGVNQTNGNHYSRYVTYNGTRMELYDNGPFVTAEGVGSNGTDYSELQDASLGMTTYGSGCQISAGNSIADDFEVTEVWDIESFTFYAYQTGSGTTSTLNDVRCQVYDGDPSAGGTVIWGDFNTNIMESTAWTNSWRVLESAPSEDRPIMEIVADATGLQLIPGTYWVEMSLGGTGASGPWAQAVTIVGETTTGNSIQKTATGWAPLEDVGPQGLPFTINGTGGVQLDDDLGISAIPQPATGVNLTDAEAIAITIKNYGLNSQSNIPWTVNWDGPTGPGSATGTYSGTIASGETATVDLTQTADLSTYGDYVFTACTNLSGDEKPENDCKEKTVTNKFPTYCDASTTYEDEYIANVLCGTIDNSSGWQGGVADYTAFTTAIGAGQSEDIIVTNGNPWGSDKVTIWVDWNMNYEFDSGDEEFVLTSNAGGANFTGAIVVPPATPEGDYRMRIRMSYSTDPTPCGVMSYGEVEDYTITVGEGAANDVGVSALNLGGFYEPGVVTPKATVKNFGSATQTFNVTMTIGSYSSTKSVTALATGDIQEVTFDTWNATVGSYTAEACTQLAGDENPANDCKSMGITVAEGNFVFAYNAYDPSGAIAEGPVTFDVVNPGNMNLLAPTTTAEFIAGATWANDTWYGCMYTGGLYTIDTQTGEMVLVGSSPDMNGLAWDGATMYGASSTTLYTIDPATGAGTVVGELGTTGGLMIGIAADAAGNLYGYDIGDDNFYSIDKATGAATVIGPLGHNFNYAQDMAYDKVNGVCYLAGYTTTGGLYSVDVTTGAATFLAGFAGGAEITGFAIPGETAPPAGPAPIDFAANYVAGSGVVTSWEMPEVAGQWKRWDDGTNWGSLGLEEAGTFWAAARWEPSDLTGLGGQYITEFEFYPMFYNNAPGIKLMIWEGAGAANLVYEQVLTGLTWDEFNTISLDQAHMIDASVELMVGFEITQPLGEYPIGYDEGPAVAGKGDLVSLDGINFVSMATEFEIDNNFNLGIYIAEEVDGMVGKKQILARNTVSNPSATFVTQSEKSGGANLAGTTRGLEGFNIYRDNVKVNANPISATARTYTDVFSTPGTYTYFAKAIYTGGLSDPSNPVEVIIPGGSDPTISVNPMSLTELHATSQITTKTLTVTNAGSEPLVWEATATTNSKQGADVSSSDPEGDLRILNQRLAAEPRQNLETDQSPMGARTFTNGTDEQWDVLYTFSAQAPSCQAVSTDGINMYMTYWNGTGLFDKFDMDGNYISSFTLSGAAAIRDLTYDGTYFYGAPSGGMSIAILDLANETTIGTITISSSAGVTGSRHLSYDPELDNGNGGFWLGQWGELAAVDMTGNTLYSNSQTPAPESCYGSAYDAYSTPGAPKLWLFTQNAGQSANDLIMLEEFDINTRTFTGFTMDLFTLSANMPGYIPGTAASATIAGGATSYVDANNKFVLAVNIQQSPNLVVGLELGTAGPPLTNDVRISSISSPSTGKALGIEDVIVNVQNLGTNAQSNIPFTVTVDGASFYSGTVAGPLAMGESIEVDCGTIDLSEELGEWVFEACTMMAGDENPDNDCKEKTVIHLEPTYCDASTSNGDEHIANVLCGSIDNSSGWQGGVADYTDIFTEIDAGASEDITITNGNAWSSDKVTVWVDWNMNYEFDDGDEKFVLTSNGGGATFTGAIAVPAGTPNGDYRMRIRMSYSTDPVPCGLMSYGEVEDYTIKVGGGTTTAWLSIPENTGGTLAPGGSAPVTVTFNSNDLSNGTYTGAINFTSNDPNNPLVVVPATLTKGGGSGIVVAPMELEEIHENPPQLTTKDVTITNTGTTPIEWSMVANAPTKQTGATIISNPVENQRILTGGLKGHSNSDLLSQANTTVATPSPNQTDDEVIRYDNGTNDDAIGLTSGGTFEVSAYWPASTMGQYAGMKLSQVEVYINDVPSPFTIKIYGAGTSTVPGALLHEETVAVTGESWNVIELSQEVDITGADIWIGYEVTHGGSEFPAGCDAGPAVAGFGDMISLDGVSFEPMSGLGLNYNWNIASTLVEGGTPPLTAWLSVPENTGGTLGAGQSVTVPVTFNSANLSQGTYNGTLDVTSNDPNNPLVIVTATLEVGESTPGIHVTPMTLAETHNNPPEQTQKDIMITNSGDTPLDVTISIDLGGNDAPAFSINPEADERKLAERLAAEGIVNSTGRAPFTSYVPTGEDLLPINSLGRDMVFAYNAYDPSSVLVEGPITFDLETPGSLTQLAATSSSDFIAGACWADGTWYGCMYGGGLYTIDEETGTMTLVGASPDLSGIAWDGSTMYGASVTSLYTIDPATGAGTLIGPLGTTGGLMIGIGCDADGDIYGYDIGDDNFYSINKNTGAATVVGPLGFDYNYAQDMAFDKDNDICYLAGYTTTGGLYTVNVATGAATLVGNFAGGAEVTGFAIPYTSGPPLTKDLSLSSIVSPTTGVNLTSSEAVIIKIKNNGTAAQSNFPWTVTWNGPTGAGSANGTYSGSLAAGVSVEITAGTADLSTYGDYTFEACVNLAGDENPANNCKEKTVSNNPPTYCPATTNTQDEFISNVLCGSINNSSGWQGGVADYTDIYAEINAGESEAITVTNGNAWSSDKVTCWVDWNMNYEFEDGAEKFVLTSNAGGANFTGAIAVPAGTPNGDYRMRVRMSYSLDPVPCGPMSYGEVEDYTIKVGGSTTTAWLSIDEGNENFTLAPNEARSVTVYFNSDGLENGLYTGAVNVASNDPENPLVEVIATLAVNGGGGELVVNPTSLTETHIVPPAQITTQVLNLTNNTGAPVSWTLAIDAGTDAGALNLVPEVSAETPVYTGQIQVESQPGVTPGEMVEGPAYTNYAIYNGTRGELYNNGGFVTAAGVGSNGTDYSELQDASLGMTTYGSGCQVSAGNSIADDFVVTDNWTVESFTFFAYQTGSGNTSTLNDVRCQIYDGDPSAGGTVIWGNLTTNLMTSTSWTNAFRVLESSPSENRPIFEIVAGTSGLTLSPGTYWVEMQIGGTAASGPWAPPITIVGQTTTGNSIQKTATGWAPLEDVGPQGLPFIITGTGEVAPWLSASPVSGTIPAGQSVAINVTFNSEGLDVGTYDGFLTISSSQPDIVVPVTFNVETGGVGEPPTNLAYTIEDFVNVDLTWNAPGGGFDPEWITYSNEDIGNSIGTGGAISFDVAARWTPDMLGDFAGGMVTKIDFVPGEPGNVSTYEVKVWQGGNNNPTLKYSQAVTNIVEDQWNVVTLTQPVAIDITQELWIGFSVNTTGGHPAGCDGGPQTEGFGNMMFWNGAWTTLSQLGTGLDYDWCVKGYVEGGMQVEGYNVYRKGTSGNFSLIGNTSANTLNYLDENLDYGTYHYHVKAQYAAGESGPSNQVTVEITSISDPSGASSALQVYPNPANDHFTIKAETEIQSVIMVNYSGQVVMNRKATGNEMLINANEFAKGVYTLQVETKDGRSVHKVVIQ